MRLIIAGCRDFHDYFHFERQFTEHGPRHRVTEVLSGAARGVDALGELWAAKHSVPVRCFPAEWDRYGKGAGPRRNAAMVAQAGGLFVLWDGVSRGTRDLLQQARDAYVCIWYAPTPGVDLTQPLRNLGL